MVCTTLTASHLIIRFIFEFIYLAALAVMSVCPVCNNHHQEEVEQCQRCNWSMQDNIEISLENSVLITCIHTLAKKLEEAIANQKKLQSIIQKLELGESDSRKLDEILDELENNRKQTHKQFKNIVEKIDELKSSSSGDKNSSSDMASKAREKTLTAQNQNVSSPVMEHDNTEVKHSSEQNNDLAIDSDVKISNPVSLPSFINNVGNNNFLDRESDRNLNNSSNFRNHPEESSLYESESDHNTNIDFNPINEPQEGSLYAPTGDLQSSETKSDRENNELDNNHNGSYQSFYRLIKRGELEVIKVTIPQETLEKARSGTQSELKFAEDKKGNYWIIDWQGVYCLIPKEKNLINQYQYANFQRVFNCQDYYEDYSKIEIIEPATVANYDGEHWRLERKGKIKFI